jgi:hypothetical protein
MLKQMLNSYARWINLLISSHMRDEQSFQVICVVLDKTFSPLVNISKMRKIILFDEIDGDFGFCLFSFVTYLLHFVTSAWLIGHLHLLTLSAIQKGNTLT